jgi:hypothetical protein
MACRVLGMTFVSDRANVFEANENNGTRTPHLLRFLQNGSLPTRVEFTTPLLMLQHEQLFERGQKMRHPAPREIFNPISLLNFFNHPHARQEVLRKTRALAKGYF